MKLLIRIAKVIPTRSWTGSPHQNGTAVSETLRIAPIRLLDASIKPLADLVLMIEQGPLP